MSIKHILEQGLLATHFQPIVGLVGGETLGFEALTRGPAGTDLASPRALFHAAEGDGLLMQLEQQCWRMALQSAARQIDRRSASSRLFLNVLPDTLCRPIFERSVTALLESVRIAPSSIVIEISEATRIEDFAEFRRALALYRAAGFGLAVDDAGAGHAGLLTIAEIVPDFVKIDGALIRDIDRHRARRATVEALLVLARSLDIRVIAEGIERTEELDTLRELGVRLGQGFLLGRPAEVIRTHDSSVTLMAAEPVLPAPLRSAMQSDSRGEIDAIGEHLAPCAAIEGGRPLSEAVELFESGHGDGVVIVDRGRPSGLLMKGYVYQTLGRAFGRELYLRRPADLVARAPLIVDEATPLEQVARRAMERSHDALYDHVVVTRRGLLQGVVSVQRLMGAMADSRLTAARHANPLTGLPGNAVIEREIRSRLESRATIAVMHLDLDDFKSFNDRYGFHRGDVAITMTANLIAEELAACGDATAFLGHIGGDDFLIIVDASRAAAVSTRIVAEFERRAEVLYDQQDRDAGWTRGSTRSGEPEQLPLMTLSSALAVVEPHDARHYAELVDVLTAAKREAKLRKRDRRLLRQVSS